MAVSTISNSDVVMKYNTYTLSANSFSCPISATIDNGYSFLGWVGCTTESWVSLMMIQYLDEINTTAWHMNFEPVTEDRTFRAYYLEKRI